MEEESEAAKEVVINMKNTEGPYKDLVEESSTPRSNQQMQEEPPKMPKIPEKNERPAPIKKNEGPPDLPLKLHFMLNKAESSTPRSNQQPEGRKIPKVPEMLRNLKKDEGCFYPRVVSIGPYHHGKPHLKKFEKLKTKLAWQHCETPAVLVNLYEIVEKVAREAREFYDVEGLNDIDDEAFTKMMFLDGCFILEFMLMCLQLMGEEEYHTVKMTNNDIANVKQDLFLLENQLPYNVLEALMKGNEEYELYEWKKEIKNFITMCRKLPPAVEPWMSGASNYFFWSPRKHKFKSPFHLLDMTRARFVKQSATSPSRLRCQVQHRMGSRSSSKKTATPSATSDWYSYHSARVLKSMGIWFRPNKTGSFSDVKFESQLFIRGVLTLPPILIDASTKSLLLNMLAFESSYTNLEDKQYS